MGKKKKNPVLEFLGSVWNLLMRLLFTVFMVIPMIASVVMLITYKVKTKKA